MSERFCWLLAALMFTGDECLLWPFGKHQRGYGVAYVDGVQVNTHVWVCREAHGPAPSPKHVAAHNCGVTSCCNQRHVRWATQAENLEDRRAHGTLPMGSSFYRAILSEDDVREISGSSESGASLARKKGVHPNTVYSVRSRQSWKCV